MTEKNRKTENEKSAEVAEKMYEASDYKGSTDLEKGLATTHEQVSDTYVEGTVDGVMEDVAGEDIPLKREGYKSKKA
jgi:hypothetical protein